MSEICTTNLHRTDELRQMIIDHPELPLLVFASEDANIGDYTYMCCTWIKVEMGEYLDDEHNDVNPELCYIDREEFEDDVDLHLDSEGLSNEEYEKKLNDEIAKYEPFWKPCIILYVGN